MLNALISALQFLTILPVGRAGTFLPDRMVPLFPVVGLVIGTLLCLIDFLAGHIWSMPVAAVLDTLFLVIVTGALHLDGVCDTADGLYGGRGNPEKTLSIMKDSAAGAIGVVAVIAVMAAKTAGIFSLDQGRMLLLVLVPAYARGATLFGFYFLPYGRPDGGTGRDFFNRRLTAADFSGFLILGGVSLLLGWKFLVFNLGFLLIITGIILYYKKKLGCITGDMLGAMTEITEAGLFLIGGMQF